MQSKSQDFLSINLGRADLSLLFELGSCICWKSSVTKCIIQEKPWNSMDSYLIHFVPLYTCNLISPSFLLQFRRIRESTERGLKILLTPNDNGWIFIFQRRFSDNINIDFFNFLKIQWRLIFAFAISCSRLRPWVSYFMYFKLTYVFLFNEYSLRSQSTFCGLLFSIFKSHYLKNL